MAGGYPCCCGGYSGCAPCCEHKGNGLRYRITISGLPTSFVVARNIAYCFSNQSAACQYYVATGAPSTITLEGSWSRASPGSVCLRGVPDGWTRVASGAWQNFGLVSASLVTIGTCPGATTPFPVPVCDIGYQVSDSTSGGFTCSQSFGGSVSISTITKFTLTGGACEAIYPSTGPPISISGGCVMTAVQANSFCDGQASTGTGTLYYMPAVCPWGSTSQTQISCEYKLLP